MTRQKRVGQYSWLVLAALVGSFIWLYADTVSKTTALKQIAAIQTVPVAEGKDVVLSLTLIDGNIVQYLVKSPPMTFSAAAGVNGQNVKSAEKSDAQQEGFSKEPVQNWRLQELQTATSFGAANLPVGIALKIVR